MGAEDEPEVEYRKESICKEPGQIQRLSKTCFMYDEEREGNFLRFISFISLFPESLF